MVFTTSETETKIALTSCEDPEAQYTKDSKLLIDDVDTAPRRGQERCCASLPWFLLFVCMIMLFLVSGWGWNEHFKLVAVLDQQKEATYEMVDFTTGIESNTSEDPPIQPVIPYGDDAHYAEGPPEGYDTLETHFLFLLPFFGGPKEEPNNEELSMSDPSVGGEVDAEIMLPAFPIGELPPNSDVTGVYDVAKAVVSIDE